MRRQNPIHPSQVQAVVAVASRDDAAAAPALACTLLMAMTLAAATIAAL